MFISDKAQFCAKIRFLDERFMGNLFITFCIDFGYRYKGISFS